MSGALTSGPLVRLLQHLTPIPVASDAWQGPHWTSRPTCSTSLSAAVAGRTSRSGNSCRSSWRRRSLTTRPPQLDRSGGRRRISGRGLTWKTRKRSAEHSRDPERHPRRQHPRLRFRSGQPAAPAGPRAGRAVRRGTGARVPVLASPDRLSAPGDPSGDLRPTPLAGDSRRQCRRSAAPPPRSGALGGRRLLDYRGCRIEGGVSHREPGLGRPSGGADARQRRVLDLDPGPRPAQVRRHPGPGSLHRPLIEKGNWAATKLRPRPPLGPGATPARSPVPPAPDRRP